MRLCKARRSINSYDADLLAQTKEDFFMLYNVVVNDWDETTYVPTALGNALLAAVIVVLLVAAVTFARLHIRIQKQAQKGDRRELTIRQLVFCAMAVALGTVLSNIKLFHFPTGGSITLLSMLVACLPGYFFGLGAGLMTGLAYGVLQLVADPYVLYPMQLVMDYLLAFGALQCQEWAAQGLYCGCAGALCVHRGVGLYLLCLVCMGGLERASVFNGVQWHLYLCGGWREHRGASARAGEGGDWQD